MYIEETNIFLEATDFSELRIKKPINSHLTPLKANCKNGNLWTVRATNKSQMIF